ncbi:HRDC domain-containing protein [Clostridium sp. HMP27]|uniref:HRDC domain-containing protein n=1 Tax=Clostridium sp. HMP27 TaxID=1487921 RepID=UPI0009DFE80F|nr:HRDC domain-containing protein [Clostridium sp. HMP27]
MLRWNKESIIKSMSIKSVEDDYEKLYEFLRKYRADTCRAEGLKPYFIFNNAELEEII